MGERIDKIKAFGADIARNTRQVKDRYNSRRVDVAAARDNDEFKTFLEKTGEADVDWEDKAERVRIQEAFINFERYTETSKNYTELFDSKLQSLAEGHPTVSTDIEAHLLKMAKENPDALRLLEKDIKKAKESEEKIAKHQKEIDVYAAVGGKEGLEMKIDTLKKAKSWQSSLLRMMGRKSIAGWGEEYSMAADKAKKEYGLEDKKHIKKAIEATNKDVKTIDQSEKQKDRIRSSYGKARGEIFSKNEIAKEIQKSVEEKLTERMGKMDEIKTIDQFHEAQRMITEAQKQFAEGSKEAKVGDLSSAELKKFQKDLEVKLETVLEEALKAEIEKAPADKLTELVNRHIKQTEFAGIPKKESMKRAYEAFVKIKNKMKADKDAKFSALSMAISIGRMELV